MKKIVVLLMCVSSFSQAMVVCRNTNQETQKQTIIILDNGLLKAVCLKDVSPEAPKKSSAEMCARDMYLGTDASGISIGEEGSTYMLFNSTRIEATENETEAAKPLSSFSIVMPHDSKTASLSVSPAYSMVTVEGNNRVEIATGDISMECETVNKK